MTTLRLKASDFFVTAISNYVKMLRRKQIDAAFAGMVEDVNYLKESKLMEEEFTPSDFEALAQSSTLPLKGVLASKKGKKMSFAKIRKAAAQTLRKRA